MGALVLGTDYAIIDGKPNAGVKQWLIQTKNTCAQNDTLALNLESMGIASDGLMAVKVVAHGVDGSTIIPSTATTAVAAGVLTITFTQAITNTRVVYLVGRGRNIGWTLTTGLV